MEAESEHTTPLELAAALHLLRTWHDLLHAVCGPHIWSYTPLTHLIPMQSRPLNIQPVIIIIITIIVDHAIAFY